MNNFSINDVNVNLIRLGTVYLNNNPGLTGQVLISQGGEKNIWSTISGSQGQRGNKGYTGPQGREGSQGKLGPQGLMGPQGRTGAAGRTGPSGGADGEKGDTGPQGLKGDFGGPTGNQGYTGPQGNQGDTGEQGSQGNQGDTGSQGNQGDTGPQGNQGIQGVTGQQGNQGVTGSQGPQGNQGATGQQGNQGDNGEQGPQGNQGVTGSQGPQGPQGNQGDTGEQGPQGNQGVTGPQGNQGVTGPQGNQGVTGTQGNQGVTGPQGNQGVTGSQGSQGTFGGTVSSNIDMNTFQITNVSSINSATNLNIGTSSTQLTLGSTGVPTILRGILTPDPIGTTGQYLASNGTELTFETPYFGSTGIARTAIDANFNSNNVSGIGTLSTSGTINVNSSKVVLGSNGGISGTLTNGTTVNLLGGASGLSWSTASLTMTELTSCSQRTFWVYTGTVATTFTLSTPRPTYVVFIRNDGTENMTITSGTSNIYVNSIYAVSSPTNSFILLPTNSISFICDATTFRLISDSAGNTTNMTASGTITAGSYDLSSGATTKDLFTTQTADANLFGNLGAGSTVRIGNQTTPQSVYVSKIDCNGEQINNIINTTGNLNIANLQTSGILNIGTTTTRTGTINIGTGAGTGNTSTIQLGSSTGAGAISINRPLTIGYTINPVAGQIGEVIRITSLTPTAFTTGQSTQITRTISINNTTLSRGIWYTSATMGIACTTAVGTISQTSLYIQQISPTVLVGNQRDDVPPYTASVALLVFNIKNTSGVLVMTGSNTVRLSYEMTYIGEGAVYTTINNNFVWTFTRIA